MNSQSEKFIGFTGISGVHPLPADENDDAIRKHTDAIHSRPDNLLMNTINCINAARLFDIPNNNERDSIGKTRQNKTDKSLIRTKQDRKRSPNYRTHGMSQVNKQAEARQVDKVEKIDSAASGLKYNASHARIHANSKRKRSETKSGEQERIRGNNTCKKKKLLSMADNQAHRKPLFNMSDRSVSGMKSRASINDTQSSTDWSRVIERGKEMRPKKKKVKKLDVSIERKKDTSKACIVENIALSPYSKYSLANVTARQAKSSETDNSINRSGMEDYITLQEGEQVRIKNLSNNQVSDIIGFNKEISQHAENRCHKENTRLTAININNMSQDRRLIVLTPEKLNQSIDERKINRVARQTPAETLLPIENRATGSQMNSSAQKTLERISSSAFQSSTPTKLSLKQKLIADKQKNINSSPSSKQRPLSSDKSLISKENTNDRKNVSLPIAKSDSRLPHRSTTVRRNLISQIFGEDETPIKRKSMSPKKRVEIGKNNANVTGRSSAKSLKKSESSTKKKKDNFPVKFMQLGRLIKRRDVKYFYLGAVKREQSLPAEVRIPAYNMQRSASAADIEQYVATKLRSLGLSPNDSQHSNSIIMVDNIPFVGLHGSLATVLKDADLPSAHKVRDTSKKNPHSSKIGTQSTQNTTKHYRTSTNQSNESIQKKKQTFSRIDEKPRADNNAGKDQVPCRSSSIDSVKLLSPDKDSQLKFLAMDSPMNEHEKAKDLMRRRFELDKSAGKENNFSQAKSSRTATSMPKTQQLSSESSEYIFRVKSDKKRKRRIVDDEQAVNESSNENDYSPTKFDDITMRILSRETKLDASKERSTPLNNEMIIFDSNEQDSRLRKYKRIKSTLNYDSESESSAHDMRNQKR